MSHPFTPSAACLAEPLPNSSRAEPVPGDHVSVHSVPSAVAGAFYPAHPGPRVDPLDPVAVGAFCQRIKMAVEGRADRDHTFTLGDLDVTAHYTVRTEYDYSADVGGRDGWDCTATIVGVALGNLTMTREMACDAFTARQVADWETELSEIETAAVENGDDRADNGFD